ncbi:MAG: MFS transporter [Actinobacteria bacterium]|nr:MFS transporter [Actinomycetota bacterium]
MPTDGASVTNPASAGKPVKGHLAALVFLGLLAAIQGSDPNIASSALLSASKDLNMGSLAALAASISTFMLAATVITTGMMADRLGRLRILTAGLILSAIGDVLVALAPGSSVFLLGRTLAGIGLGAVFGASFAYVKTFASGKGGLAGALGVYGAATGGFAVLLSFVGATLVGVDWRIAFLLIPVASIISVFVGFVILPKDGKIPKSSKSWDTTGQVLLGLGVIAFLYGISYVGKGLGDPQAWVPLLAGTLLLLGWYFWERGRAEAFFPVRLFVRPLFIAALLAGLIYNLGSGAMLLSFSTLFQYQLDLSGIGLSLSQLPYLLAAVVGALVTGRLMGSGKLSNGGATMAGALICALGLVLFGVTAMSAPSSVIAYLPALVVTGVGVIIPSIPYGGLILAEADPEHYGAVSSSRTTIGQFYYAMGLALSTVIIDSLTRSRTQDAIGGDAAEQIRQFAITGQPPTNPAVLPKAIEALGGAFAVMCFILAVLFVVAGFVALVVLRRNEKKEKASATAA